MLSIQSKIRGMFLGVAIGDQLGRCTEGMTPNKIKENYGRVTTYRCPKNRHWKNKKARVWTDDTQLTLATAQAFIDAGRFDMQSIAYHHILAAKQSTEGWGRSTRESVERLSEGISWKDSAGRNNGTGLGNGVPMKIAPLVAYFFLKKRFNAEQILKFSFMTHYSRPAVEGGLMHATGIEYCLKTLPEQFNIDDILGMISHRLFIQSWKWKWFTDITSLRYADSMEKQMHVLIAFVASKNRDIIKKINISKQFGYGNFFVYNSLPFTYYFFLKNPMTFETIIRLANAGGDTDSNASMAGALLGALHGEEIFPAHLVKNLQDPELVLNTANQFYERFRK